VIKNLQKLTAPTSHQPFDNDMVSNDCDRAARMSDDMSVDTAVAALFLVFSS